MYVNSCRILQLTFQRKFTCTVRVPNLVQPANQFHSAPLNTRRLLTSKILTHRLLTNSPSPRYISLTTIQRNVANSSTAEANTITVEIPDMPTPLSVPVLSSSSPISTDASVLDIPAPPAVPASSESVAELIAKSSQTEVPFSEIGLGGWSPSGLIQSCLEWVHVGLDLPWWGAIAVGVFTVRTLMLPLVIKAQQNAAKMTNNMPQLQVLQHKMTQARQSGNSLQTAQLAYEMQTFMKEKGVNPFKNMIVPLIQAPVFMSFFFALKGMANTPVESLKNGGLFWFTDLTVCDPYYILPLLTSITVWATIELGTDAARLNTQGSPLLIYVFRALPVIMFPITMNFSSAILCYWLTTNLISLVQVGILRIPKVRDYCNIERIVTVAPIEGAKSKGFRQSLKEAWTNQKITSELNERQRLMETTFKKAGTGPIQKTYSYDPTKQTAQKVLQRGLKETKKTS